MADDRTWRVVFIDAAPWFGGAQHSLWTLVRELRNRSVDPFVLSADESDTGLLARCRHEGIACQRVRAHHWKRSLTGFVGFLGDRFVSGRAVSDAIRQHAASLVHANGLRSALLLPGVTPPECPLVVHDRDIRGPEKVRVWVGRRARRVLAISRCVADCWGGLVPPERVHVVHNGFDIEAIRRAADTRAVAEADGGLGAVLVADLVRWKRHELFLEALRIARETEPSLCGVLVGRPRGRQGREYLAELQRATAAMGLRDAVRFITDADTALPWIAGADIVLNVSDKEPFGRTVVEALALGKAVVVTEGGGPEEIVSDCPAGAVVEGTPDAVAAGMLQWRRGADREQVRRAALARSEQFRSGRVAESVMAHYEELTTP